MTIYFILLYLIVSTTLFKTLIIKRKHNISLITSWQQDYRFFCPQKKIKSKWSHNSDIIYKTMQQPVQSNVSYFNQRTWQIFCNIIGNDYSILFYLIYFKYLDTYVVSEQICYDLNYCNIKPYMLAYDQPKTIIIQKQKKNNIQS